MKPSKVMVVAILLIIISSPSLFSLDLRELNGNNWFSWEIERRIGYVQGALLEGFRITELSYLMGIIYDIEKFYSFRIESDVNYQTSDVEVCNEISNFYIRTQRFDYPVYIVIYIRNYWQFMDDFPEWKDSPWAIKGEDNERNN